MPTFTAKEKNQLSVKPGEKVPGADFGGLRHYADPANWPRVWSYSHDSHSLDDLMRPDYFGGLDVRSNLRPGDTIHFCLKCGEKKPSLWTRGILVIEEVPNVREKPVLAGGVVIYPKATVSTGKPDDKAAAA